MSPKEKDEHRKESQDSSDERDDHRKQRQDAFEEKDLDDVKFKGRDDENTSPGTPRSPLPGGIKKHEKNKEKEATQL